MCALKVPWLMSHRLLQSCACRCTKRRAERETIRSCRPNRGLPYSAISGILQHRQLIWTKEATLHRQGSNGSGFSRKHTKPEYPVEIRSQAETLPLRQDMVTLLRYVRDNKVVGARSTGNLPLKAVREVTAHFVEPPILDMTFGERTYRLRSETEVWPLYYLHILAQVGGLVLVAPGRRWRLTTQGKTFLGASAFDQVVFLLTTWWGRVNWLVAYSVAGMGSALPDFFEIHTLAQLRACPVGEAISAEKFADDLADKTGLEWTAPDDSLSARFLRSSIESMVIEILESFGAVETKYRYREEILGLRKTISRLDTFQITAFGKVLLNALTVVYG